MWMFEGLRAHRRRHRHQALSNLPTIERDPHPEASMTTETLAGPALTVGNVGSLFALLTEPRTRWPRLRTGERDPINPVVRRLVYQRDGHSCRFCGGRYDLQLDHVIPWSAFGPDTSDNLRTLCDLCNDDRSNYREPYEGPQTPVTRWCFWCMFRPDDDGEDREVPDPHDRKAAFCGCCGTTSWVPTVRIRGISARGWLL
jgi:hypothetical protein